MTRQRALVTGGAGFLGSHLCDALLAAGYSVVAVDNLLTGRLRNLAHLKSESRFEFREIDVCESFDCGPVDYVFHFASPASPVDYSNHGIATLKVGSLGTFHALDIARRYRAKFLVASTSECYGDPLEHPQKETYWGHVNPIGPRSVYDEAKRFTEAATVAYRRYYDVDTHIVRIFNTYGPRMQLTLLGALAGQHRESQRIHDSGVRADGAGGDGVQKQDPLRTLAPGRSQTTPARHHESTNSSRLGAERAARGRAQAQPRLFSGSGGG